MWFVEFSFIDTGCQEEKDARMKKSYKCRHDYAQNLITRLHMQEEKTTTELSFYHLMLICNVFYASLMVK